MSANTTSADSDGDGQKNVADKRSSRRTLTFRPLQVLGIGGFGEVQLVRKMNEADKGTLYALKMVHKDQFTRRYVGAVDNLRERQVLGMVKHPFVIELKYAFQNDSKLYYVLEFAPGGELRCLTKKLGKLDEPTAVVYSAEILSGLSYLHAKDIIHRDLKPQNILMDREGHLKITDFGFSKANFKDDDSCYSAVGTPYYMARELVAGESYGKAADWWSFATIVYELLTGKILFSGKSDREIYRKILKFKLCQLPDVFSPPALDVLHRTLCKQSNRADGKELKNHTFFAQINWDDLENKRVPAPYKPRLKDETDVSFFSRRYRQMVPRDDPGAFSHLDTVLADVFRRFRMASNTESRSVMNMDGH